MAACRAGGKPPILLTLEPDRFASIGIDIGHESLLRGVLCNAAGTPVVTREITHDNRFETILEQAVRLVGELKDAGRGSVCGVGSRHSRADRPCVERDRLLRELPAETAEFRRSALRTDLAAGSAGKPARTAALWEYYFGAAGRTEDFIFISAERGIGTAIYLGGRLLQGRSGAAGKSARCASPPPTGVPCCRSSRR